MVSLDTVINFIDFALTSLDFHLTLLVERMAVIQFSLTPWSFVEKFFLQINPNSIYWFRPFDSSLRDFAAESKEENMAKNPFDYGTRSFSDDWNLNMRIWEFFLFWGENKKGKKFYFVHVLNMNVHVQHMHTTIR